MSFDELERVIGLKYSSMKLSDIARELDVSPQVVSNWKARNQVPFKYIKKMRALIDDEKNVEYSKEIHGFIPYSSSNENDKTRAEFESLNDFLSSYLKISKKYYKYQITITLLLIASTFIYSTYYIEPVYASSARLLPSAEGSGGTGNVSRLAERFGISSGSPNPAGMSSTGMFPIVLQSRRLGYELIEKKFDTKIYGKNRKLIDIIFKNRSNVEKKYNQNEKRIAVNKILKNIYVKKDRGSGLITLKAEAIEADLSAQIVNKSIEILQTIMRYYTLGKSTEKKEFINSRFEDVLKRLSTAEEDLKSFREKNRLIFSSPKLMLEEARLFRETEVQTEIYITLKTQLEMLNVEESGKHSLVQILDQAEVPSAPIKPQTKKNLWLSFFFSLILCGLGTVSVDSFQRFYRKK
jgi:uncharacterized protein involved in exopolysaccharide biosynthesis